MMYEGEHYEKEKGVRRSQALEEAEPEPPQSSPGKAHPVEEAEDPAGDQPAGDPRLGKGDLKEINRSWRIAVVDDESESLASISRALRKVGYDVISFDDG